MLGDDCGLVVLIRISTGMVLIPFSLELDSCSLKVKWNQATAAENLHYSMRNTSISLNVVPLSINAPQETSLH